MAYSSLQEFMFDVRMIENESYANPEALGVLPQLLSDMRSLELLVLTLKTSILINENDQSSIHYRSYHFDQIFSETCNVADADNLTIIRDIH